jgi:hypothetical protein
MTMPKMTGFVSAVALLCVAGCTDATDKDQGVEPSAGGASAANSSAPSVSSGAASQGATADTAAMMAATAATPMPGSTASGGTGTSMDPMAGAGEGGAANSAGAMNVTDSGGVANAGGASMTSDSEAAGADAGPEVEPAGELEGDPTVDGSKFTIASHLASEDDAAAPTTVGIVNWSTTIEATAAHIEFGLDTMYGMDAPVDLSEADYRTLLLGMKPDSTYHFRVVASDATVKYASEDNTIQTGPATNAVGIGSFSVTQEEGRERGFIVTSYWAGTGSSVAFILDADGDIVWWHDFGFGGGTARARMSYNGHDMWAITANNQGEPIARVGMDGLNAQTYSGTSGSHDIAAVAGDTMAYLDYSVGCNDINEIDPSGTVTKVFTASAVFGNQCHANALRYSDTEGEYTFSVVDRDIIRLDRTGNQLWSLAEQVQGGVNTWGGVNHGHHLLADSLLIFANRGGANGTSAMIEYDLTGGEIGRYESGNSSANLGDVQRLPGGNTLVDFSNDGVIQEVDPSGQVLLEITGPGAMNSFGYATWRPTLYGPSPDITD